MLTRLFAAVRGLIYASAFVWLWWWVVASARPLDRRIALSIPSSLRPVGLVLVALGGLLALTCVLSFALVGRGTPAPFDAPRDVVAAGPHRWVRNPMYLGALLVLFGVGVLLRSPAALAVAVGFFALAHLFVLLYEEPTLERRFGASYRRYRSEVRRWLPRPPRTADRGGASEPATRESQFR